MMKASPTSPLEVAKPAFLLEVLIVALDTPAQLGFFDEVFEGDVGGLRREPIFGGLDVAFGPFDQQPFVVTQLVAMSGADANGRLERGFQLFSVPVDVANNVVVYVGNVSSMSRANTFNPEPEPQPLALSRLGSC